MVFPIFPSFRTAILSWSRSRVDTITQQQRIQIFKSWKTLAKMRFKDVSVWFSASPFLASLLGYQPLAMFHPAKIEVPVDQPVGTRVGQYASASHEHIWKLNLDSNPTLQLHLWWNHAIATHFPQEVYSILAWWVSFFCPFVRRIWQNESGFRVVWHIPSCTQHCWPCPHPCGWLACVRKLEVTRGTPKPQTDAQTRDADGPLKRGRDVHNLAGPDTLKRCGQIEIWPCPGNSPTFPQQLGMTLGQSIASTLHHEEIVVLQLPSHTRSHQL